MFLIDATKRLIGLIQVEQIIRPRGYPLIKVTGIRGDFLAKDIGRYYKTTKVPNAIFDSITRNTVVLPAFFALEFSKYLTDVITNGRGTYVPRRTASAILKALQETTWIGKTLEEDIPKRLNYNNLDRFVYQPLPYQLTWLQKFEKVGYQFTLNGAILDAAAGSGKTMSSLYLAECSEVDHVIIISPKNALRRVWVETITTHIKTKPSWWCSDTALPPRGEKYLIYHFEAIEQALSELKNLKGKKIAIVVDESHNFNTETSLRTQRLIELCKTSKSDIITLQSGTPFKAIGAEIVPALFCIDPTFTDELAVRFRKLYAASATDALQLLTHRLGMISHKVTKDELGLKAPEITNLGVRFPGAEQFTLAKVSLEMTEYIKERQAYYKERKSTDEALYLDILEQHEYSLKNADTQEYKTYLNDVKLIRKGDLRSIPVEIKRANSYENGVIIPKLTSSQAATFKEVKTIYKYVTLKIQGECLGRVLGKRRMECSVAIAQNFDYEKYIEMTTKKTLVYTIYVQALEQAVKRLEEMEYKPLAVYGETNKNMVQIVESFEKDDTLNPLVATFHSLSTAVPLTMADVMVMLDVPWRDYILQQTISRVSRLGATTQPRIFICGLDTGTEPNLSSRTVDILVWSQEQMKKITGHESPYAIDERVLTVESHALVGKELPLLTDDLEERFMTNLV